MVYVLNQNGQSLMPTENHAKVRVLLKQGKAKVVNKCPFTIQLLYSSTNYTQKVTLGVDSGSKYIGISVTTSYGFKTFRWNLYQCICRIQKPEIVKYA